MRRVHAAAIAAILPATLVAACSNRPNDLYTYYDDPTATTTTADAPQPAAIASTPAAAPTSTASSSEGLVAAAALTPADLAEEEVTAAPDQPVESWELPCAVTVGAGRDAGTATAWRYASGAELVQYVAHTREAVSATAAIKVDKARCERRPSTSSAPTSTPAAPSGYRLDQPAALPEFPGVDAKATWCAGTANRATCAVVLASGEVVSAVAVTASSASRARTALTRVSAKAYAALTRDA
ncbi:hypothetical protein V5P93_002885 [Actinokineospora auranticolor]|uniref:PknH-like protein n=1 Tax=Actinokineospora auranticolor TaxID=155976 RepID=A0A2S6H0U0_9PSEU|nr:hypothetical protein [Actinokineospora auranticolor]PPK71027.1 hypothetical protein CLV40_101213 [Actinokineospora auranticolor]